MNYNINTYHNKVYEILNFITEEEQKIILDIINNSTEEDWPLSVDNEFKKNDEVQSGKNFFIKEKDNPFIDTLDQRVQSLFKNSGRINQITSIQRYRPNTFMGLHKDDILDSSVLFGVVIYLNDDFEGGEITYPELDLKIKPKARSMVVHPAGLEHGVLEVKGEQTRYTFSVFVRGDSTTKFLYSGE